MANSKSIESEQQFLDLNPFEGFKIDDTSLLFELEGRHPCSKCGKSRKFFCYTCYIPISPLEGKLPKVKLPIKIDIIKHKHEIDGKSTASHAALLAHEDIKVYTYPDIPDYTNENVILIFPAQKAISVSQLVNGGNVEKLLEYQEQPLDQLPAGYNRSTLMKTIPQTRQESVFIDSTWHQCKSIYKDEKIRMLPCVVIQNRISQFWRHQKGSPRWYLATVEAIHQFILEIHLHCWGLNPKYKGIEKCFTEKNLKQIHSFYTDNENAYNGQYDNLLYFFKHMYDVIHSYYKHEDLYAYKRRLM
ncbi:tRNA-uridine aminocarboxypropyltransferase 1 isoform X2 [Rhynchophorus ferrugineus]|uniref:tRNA-uridine aminocarboxypropyltransferase 1 isoform X2 n=1 Tax=Rhynchophorus ferrugineus TaxID=354439 RepID=UPI003FCCE919